MRAGSLDLHDEVAVVAHNHLSEVAAVDDILPEHRIQAAEVVGEDVLASYAPAFHYLLLLDHNDGFTDLLALSIIYIPHTQYLQLFERRD